MDNQRVLFNKTLVIIITLLFICLNISSLSAVDNINKSSITISTGNILYVGGNGSDNYSKIQDAIDDANDGDTVFVYDDSSPYYEYVVINKSINLIGENRNTTIIEGSNDTYVIFVNYDNVNIYNFTIQNKENCNGILISNSQGCTIIDNYITINNINIEIENSSNIIIQGNTIESKWEFSGPPSWAPCIYIKYSNQNIVINNTIYHISKSFSGIDISGSNGNIIMGNIFYNNSEGLMCCDCKNNTISKNIIHSSYYGILLHLSNNNFITCNYITGNLYGIILDYKSKHNHIFNNSIESNYESGISLNDQSENNYVYKNTIEYNNYGLLIHNNCNENMIYYNSFIKNINQSYDECSNKWNRSYPSAGNYWNDYIADDLKWGENQTFCGSDGVGDTPYYISGNNNKDMYPLIKPYAMTKLFIDIFKGGLFKCSGIIKNIGNNTAFNVQWNIKIDGGILLFRRNSSGTIPKPLVAGEDTKISSNLIFGFGKIKITIAVWADNAVYVSKSIPGMLLLFFVKI